ncbi:DUF3500 domain-containing protein [Phytomonospora endophytica]|uniref:DUF3500 domain-containing protein n=1 Tax=Phytomonospora endophytica TaxID=714109 RepID=UPI0019436E94
MEAVIADEMREAARRLLKTFTGEQGAEACHPFDHDDRRRWDYRPRPRPGTSIAGLSLAGRKNVHRLLATAMSTHAFAQVTGIMGLEEVLDRAESYRRGRHSGDYWIALFGSPDAEAFAWRFEGHHVSVTMSVVGEKVSPTPVFLGADPAITFYRGTPVVRPLALEEELARRLLAELPAAQLGRAVVSSRAPDDIRTSNARDVTGVEVGPGIRAADLARGAASLLGELVDLYLDRLPPALAAAERAKLSPGEVRFAWEGPVERGGGHYYRLQSRELLVEYDNTQNDANHVHTVLRRPGDDFGAALLAAHKTLEH